MDPAPLVTSFPLVRFIRNARARRYILRVDSRGIRVTVPRGGTRSFAAEFLRRKQAWVASQWERLRAAETTRAWSDGTPIWYRGTRTPLVIAEGMVRLGEITLKQPGDASRIRPMLQQCMRRLAECELPPLVWRAAERHEVAIRRVSVRNQRTRWGSCSRRGTISLNWRLLQIPESVRDYLVAHELAHVREMNHSQRFWDVVETFFPGWREAEQWLRRHGREVMRQ